MTSTPADFRYTEDERRALAAAVPDATWLADVKDDWARMVRFPDADRFLADKVGYVVTSVEWAAREALAEHESRTAAPGEELDTAREVANEARKLLRLLRQPNSYRPDYSVAFLGRQAIGAKAGDGAAIYKDKLLVELLNEVVANEPAVRENLRTFQRGDRLRKPKHVAVAAFVSQIMAFWSVWTGGDAPGRGSQGGPAARFVMAATNPLLDFAEKKLGRTLRRGGALDEESASQLIKAHAPRQID